MREIEPWFWAGCAGNFEWVEDADPDFLLV